MRFKVGFEFQEVGGLYPWALHDLTVQRKELFRQHIAGRKEPLWSVVIDTNDIEFVTTPYTDEEISILEQCLTNLSRAFEILDISLQTRGEMTFGEWTHQIEGLAFSDVYALAHNRKIVRPHPRWEAKFSPQVTIQHPLE